VFGNSPLDLGKVAMVVLGVLGVIAALALAVWLRR
jgi:hypothetical protein